MKKKLMNSRFAKLVCRILGEEKGIEALEYAMLGILVVAGTCAAAVTLGFAVNTCFTTAALSVVGDSDNAVTYRTAMVATDAKTLRAAASAVKTANGKFFGGIATVGSSAATASFK